MAGTSEPNDAKKDKETEQVGKALDSLTDKAEERGMDDNKVKVAVERLRVAKDLDDKRQQEKERELAAVKINKEDVQVIADELGLSLKISEAHLRENGGDLEKTLRCILNAGLPEGFSCSSYGYV